MATPSMSLDDNVKKLLDQQELLLKKIAELEKAKISAGKDGWDVFGIFINLFSAISTLAIAAVGGYFTWRYDVYQSRQTQISEQHQAKLEEVQTVGTFMPYLVGTNDAGRSLALAEVGDLLSEQAAVTAAEHMNSAQAASGNRSPDPIVMNFLQHIADKGKTQASRDAASAALAKIRGPAITTEK